MVYACVIACHYGFKEIVSFVQTAEDAEDRSRTIDVLFPSVRNLVTDDVLASRYLSSSQTTISTVPVKKHNKKFGHPNVNTQFTFGTVSHSRG